MQVLVRQGDTLERIALRYLGDASQADLLASVNNLEYPFVVNDPNYDKNVYTTGQVTVTSTSTSAVIINIGDTFQTQGGASSEVRTYQALQEVTLSAKGQSATVNVQCTMPGNYGNTLAAMVTVSSVSGITVTNVLPFYGGRIYRVKVPGDFLIIPTGNTQQANTTARLTLPQYDEWGGVDLLLTPTNGLAFGEDDLLATNGPDTVGGDIAANIATPLNSVPNDPTLGSLIPSSLGLGGTYAMQRLAILAQGVASADNRVKSAGAVALSINSDNNTWINLEMAVEMQAGQTKAQIAVGGVA